MTLLKALLAAACAVTTAISVPATNVTFVTRACQPPYDSFPFCNTSLSIASRVADLISRLLPEEIPPQLTARHGQPSQVMAGDNITRLGIPEYDWGCNAQHGVQSNCLTDADGVIRCPTSFPNSVNYGSVWNMSLVREMGAIIGQELRALWLGGSREYNGDPPPHLGLDTWSPNINLARDPRWGRSMEVPGEDPLINGRYGAAYTLGMQNGEDGRYLRAITTLKHWDAYSLENSDGFTRYNFNAVVSNFTLADTYFPAFKASIVEGGAKGVMCRCVECVRERESESYKLLVCCTGRVGARGSGLCWVSFTRAA